MAVQVVTAGFIFGVPEKVPAIAGYRIHIAADEFVTATRLLDNRNFLVCDRGDAFGLMPMIPKAQGETWFDETAEFRIPKAA